MTTAEAFLFPYERSSWVLHTLADDLTPQEWTHTPVEGANCAAWIVGHIIAVERRLLSRVATDLPALPDADFEKRYAPGQGPTKDLQHGDVTKLLPLFDAQRKLLLETIQAWPDETFSTPIEHPRFKTLGQLVGLMPVHTSLHSGQLSTIRRSLGKPAAF